MNCFFTEFQFAIALLNIKLLPFSICEFDQVNRKGIDEFIRYHSTMIGFNIRERTVR